MSAEVEIWKLIWAIGGGALTMIGGAVLRWMVKQGKALRAEFKALRRGASDQEWAERRHAEHDQVRAAYSGLLMLIQSKGIVSPDELDRYRASLPPPPPRAQLPGDQDAPNDSSGS